MEDKIFNQLRSLIKRESGISLAADKKTLLENRLRKRLRALSITSPNEYLKILELDIDRTELNLLLDVVSTNLTFFFREEIHFKVLAQELSSLQSLGQKKIRGWCAAASSGEEPYSIAITAAEALNLKNCDFRLLATDICRDVLHKCLVGCYHPQQLKALPPGLLDKYFQPIDLEDGEHYRVNPDLAQNILFKRLNLASFPYPLKGPLDFIFCRNVMIYFEDDLRSKLLDEFWRLLRPGGMLVVGHSESLSSIRHRFDVVQSSVYRKPGN